MKILHVIEAASHGGASRAAARLHQALLKAGVESVFYARTGDVAIPARYRPKMNLRTQIAGAGHLAERTARRAFVGHDQGSYSVGWTPASILPSIVREVDPDVVHLHWLSGGVFDIADLNAIDRPVVWSLHDMWAFTGGCHYDRGCGKFRDTCGACPILGSSLRRDLSTWVQARKVRSYGQHANLTAIGLSRWLQREAQASRVFADVPVEQLPNPIDTEVFYPMDRAEARRALGLPGDQPLILFGALYPTSDRRKGFPELAEAVSEHMAADEVDVVVFGAREFSEDLLRQRVHDVGRVYDDAKLRLLYSACDAMVVPSRQENLANTILEALACGTPVVAFDIGGNPDMIAHEGTGWLAKPFAADDLAAGMRWAIERRGDSGIRERCFATVTERFAEGVVAQQYVELYERVVNSGARRPVELQ